MKFKFSAGYFAGFVLLFVIECLIAIYFNDSFIRPYFGDFLVVILIYCFAKAFVNTTPLPTAIGVLLFAFVVEFSQYFQLVYKLGLGDNKIARTVLGTFYSPNDLLAYTLGIIFILLAELIIKKALPAHRI